MQCEFAFVCDYAVQERKLYAVGIGWDTVFAGSLPATHPMMCFVARLKGSAAEKGTKEIAIRLLDADGADVITPIEQTLPFEVQPMQLAGYMNIVVQLGGLQLKKYGGYAIHLVMQGNEMATVGFSVAPPPATTTMS